MILEQRHTLPRFIEAMRRAPDVVMGEVDRVVGRAAIDGALEAKRGAPKAFSELVNSIRNEQIGLAFHRFIAEAGHARFIEEGTDGQRLPPIDIIRRWIESVGISPRLAETSEDLAWRIGISIARRGITAQPFMKPARDTSEHRLQALLPEALRRGTERALA